MAQALDLTGLDVHSSNDAGDVQRRVTEYGQRLYQGVAIPTVEGRPPQTTPGGGGGLDSLMESTGEGLDALRKKDRVEKDVDPIDRDYDTEFSDYIQAFNAGGNQALAAVGGLTEWLGGLVNDDAEPNSWQKWGAEYRQENKGLAEEHLNNMSEDAQALMNITFTGEDKSAIRSGRSMLLKLMNTAPAIGSGVLLTAAGAYAGTGLAVLAGLSRAAGAAVGGAVAGGATEGAMAAGFSATEIADHVESMPLEALKRVPNYQKMKDKGWSDARVREVVKADAIRVAGSYAALSGVATGSLAGGVLGKIIPKGVSSSATRTGAATKAALTEAMQEGTQESAETMSVNKGIQDVIDPSQTIMEGTKESFAAGAALGAPFGGAIGAATYGGQDKPPVAEPEITPVSDMPPPQGEQPSMAGQPPPHVPPAPEAAAAPVEGVASSPADPDAQENAVPEPPEDIAAQLKEVELSTSSRESMYVSPSNIQTEEQRAAIYDYVDARNEERERLDLPPLMVVADEGGAPGTQGVLITVDPDAAKAYRSGVPSKSSKLAKKFGIKGKVEPEDGKLLQGILGYNSTKEEAGADALAVSAVDKDGNVLKSEAVSQADAEKVKAKYEKEFEGRGTVEVKPAAQAVAERGKPGVAPADPTPDEITSPEAVTPTPEAEKPKVTPRKHPQAEKPKEKPKTKKQQREEAAAKRVSNVAAGKKKVQASLATPEGQKAVQRLSETLVEVAEGSTSPDSEAWVTEIGNVVAKVSRPGTATKEAEALASKLVDYIASNKGQRVKKAREEFIADLDTDTDIVEALETFAEVIAPRSKETYNAHRDRRQANRDMDAAITLAQKKLSSAEQATEYLALWKRQFTEKTLTKRGAPSKRGFPAATHESLSEPVEDYVTQQLKRFDGVLTEPEINRIREVQEQRKKVGKAKAFKINKKTGKRYAARPNASQTHEDFVEFHGALGEVVDIFRAAEKRKSKPNEEKPKRPTSQTSKPEEKPAPKRQSKPAETPAKQDSEEAKPPAPEVETPPEPKKKATVIKKKGRKKSAKKKEDPPTLGVHPRKGDFKEAYGVPKYAFTGKQIQFGTNRHGALSAYVWRDKNKAPFNISVMYQQGPSTRIEHYTTNSRTQEQVLAQLRDKGLEHVLDNSDSMLEPEEIVTEEDEVLYDQLQDHPLWKGLAAQNTEESAQLQKDILEAFLLASADAGLYAQLTAPLLQRLKAMQQPIDKWQRILSEAYSSFSEAVLEQDLVVDESYGVSAEQVAINEGGLTFGVDRGAVQDQKKADRATVLQDVLERELGSKEAALRELEGAEVAGQELRTMLEQHQFRSELSSKDEEVVATAKREINEYVREEKQRYLDELWDKYNPHETPLEETLIQWDETPTEGDYASDDISMYAWDDRNMGAQGDPRRPAILDRLLDSLAAGVPPDVALKKLGQHPFTAEKLQRRTYKWLVEVADFQGHELLPGLIERIVNSGFNPPVIANTALRGSHIQGVAHQPVDADGNVDPRLGVISIAPELFAKGRESELAHVFYHEMVHLATVHGLDTSPNLRTNIDHLRRLVAERLGPNAKLHYGLKDEYEFVAEVFSNPEFQELLRSIKIPDLYTGDSAKRITRRLRSAWEQFVDLLGSFFNIHRTPENTALEWALTLSNQSVLTKRDLDRMYGAPAMSGPNHSDRTVVGHHLAPRNAKEVRQAKRRLKEFSSRGLLNVMTMDQIHRRWVSKFGAPMAEYFRRWREKMGIVTTERRKGDRITRKWSQFKHKDRDGERKMTQLMIDSTMAGIDPRATVPSTGNASTIQRANELVSQYNSMTPEARNLFSEIANYHTKQRKEAQAFSMEAALHGSEAFGHVQHLSKLTNRILKMADVEQIRNALTVAARGKLSRDEIVTLAHDLNDFKKLTEVKGIYFPLSRKGEYVVGGNKDHVFNIRNASEAKRIAEQIRAGVDNDLGKTFAAGSKVHIDKNNPSRITVEEEVFEMYDTQEEAEEAAEQLRRELGSGAVFDPTTKRKDEMPALTGAMAKLATRIKRNMGTSQFNSQIDNAVIQLLAEDSIRKSDLTRRNIAGANPDTMMQAFAQRAMSSAWAIADLKTSMYMEEAFNEMHQVARKHKDTHELVRVLNHIHDREVQNQSFRNDNTIIDKISRLGYMMALASPAYSMINATQVPLVTFPVLAAKYGAAKASKAILSNTSQSIGKEFREELRATKGGLTEMPLNFVDNMVKKWGASPHVDLTVGGRLEIEKVRTKGDMLKALIDDNSIDSSFIQSLYEAIEDSSQTWKNLTTWSKAWPQMVEQINRVATAGATYDLAIEQGMNPVEATLEAREVIAKTHGDYSDANKPKFFKAWGGISKVIMMFKTYSQFISALFADNWVALVKGNNKTIPRPQAAKTLMWLHLTHTGAAGVMGGIVTQPLVMAMALVNEALGDDDDPLTYEDVIEQGILELFDGNEALAEMVTRGIPRAAGIDLFNRVGLHNILMMTGRDGLDARTEAKELIIGLLGPMAGFTVNAYAGAQQILDGDIVQGIETAAPKAVKDLLKAASHSTEGVTDKGGTPLLSAEKHGAWATTVRAAGFTPAAEARMYEKVGATIRFEKGLQTRATALRNKFYNAKTADERKEAIRAIVAFNQKNPGAYQIKPSSLSRGLKARGETEIKRDMGMYGRDPATSLRLGWATD